MATIICECGEVISEEILHCPSCGAPLMKEWVACATSGDADAQNFVAWCYHNGDGTEQNDQEAAIWWERATEQGHIPATNSLGACYYIGRGVPKDTNKAFRLFWRAAMRGYAKAQSNLAICYRNGEGVMQLYDEAAKWFLLAAKQGVDVAAKYLVTMKEEGTFPEETHEDKAGKLRQIHGDHFDAVMDTDRFQKEYMAKVIEDAELGPSAETEAALWGKEGSLSDVRSLIYRHGDMYVMSLVVRDLQQSEGERELAAMYPCMDGYTREVTVTRVLEWKNRIEAVVEFRVSDRDYYFFASDYFQSKDSYVPGKTARVSLSALGMHVSAGQQGFDFCDQKAEDFLAKLGQEPQYDDEGKVKPVHFDMNSLLAYLNIDDGAPDEAEFQSPAGNIQRFVFLDVPFVRCDINILDHDKEFTVPLYFREDSFPNVKENSPVAGWLWLTGRITLE